LSAESSPSARDTSVFLQTERLLLRRFTEKDVDNLVDLDGDSQVTRFINGGKPTSRKEVETEILPAFLWYYDNFAGYGFWAAIEKASGEFLGWFHFRPEEGASADEPDWDTDYGDRLGARATRPRDRAH
jgi:RimJ/RimL family protein N-acetyltransferase